MQKRKNTPDRATRADYYRRLSAYNRKVLDDYLIALTKIPRKTVSKNMRYSQFSCVFVQVSMEQANHTGESIVLLTEGY